MLLRLAVDDHQWVKADRGIVDEGAAVDLGDIDAALVAGSDDRRRLGKVEGNAEIAGEMVERAERQQAHRRLAAGQRAGDRAHRPVAAGGDDQLGTPA